MSYKLKNQQTTEHDEQCVIFQWAELQSAKYPELDLLNASLNGVRMKIGQAMKLKRGGMKRGYPDIFLPVARGSYHGLFIELKRKGGYPTKEQKEWLKRLNLEGYKAILCIGAETAIKEIESYLKL